MLSASQRADACTYLIPDHRFFLAEAPIGGAWWLHGSYRDENGEPLARVPLMRENGVGVFADVLSRGVGGSVALAVPEGLEVGERFLLPDFTEPGPWDGSLIEELVVVAGEPSLPPGGVPPPSLTVEVRETRVGYGGVVTAPTSDGCSEDSGIWEMQYGDVAFSIVDVPDAFVLDMTVRPEGEGAFDDVTSANQILFDALGPGELETSVQPPPGANVSDDSREANFVVHARLRRIADGAIGPVESIPVHIRDGAEKRLEWVGCSAAQGAPLPLALLGFALLLLRRRRRR